MSQLTVLSYMLATMVGFTALVVAVLGTLRSRVAPYRLVLVFYGAFTGQIAARFIREYLYVNIDRYSYQTILGTYVATTLLTLVGVAAVGLFYHRLFGVPRSRLLDAVVAGVTLFAAAAFVWPGAVTLDAIEGRFTRNLPVLIGQGAYVTLFAYILAVGAVGPKKDRPPRELVLIWSLFLFGVVGLLESLGGFVRAMLAPTVVMTGSGSGFLVSTVPYVLFAGILLYYFGSYLLAESRPPKLLSEETARRFGISAREREVIVLLNEGLGNREIAEKLFVSLATVKTHVHNIYEKTGAKGRYALFRLTAPAGKLSA